MCIFRENVKRAKLFGMEFPVRYCLHVSLNLIQKPKIPLHREENYYFCYLKLYFFYCISSELYFWRSVSESIYSGSHSILFLIYNSITVSKIGHSCYIFFGSCSEANLQKVALFLNFILKIAFCAFHWTLITVPCAETLYPSFS